MILFLDQRQQCPEEFSHICCHTVVDENVLVDLAGIDVDLDLSCLLSKLLRVQRYSITESCAKCDDQIGSVYSLVGCDASVHSDEAQILRVFPTDDAGCHQSVCSRDVCSFYQLVQLFACS